tara:strand:- start:8440 stop:10641 length:2202 start_codon:yes stop_codon:yes gene_type:complete
VLRQAIFYFSLCSFFLGAESATYADEENEYSQTTYGGVGLIVSPTSRFSSDGEFSFGISSEIPFNRLYAKSQFFPWLEAVLRYTEETDRPYGPNGQQTNKDKGIDFKIRLLKETKNLPQIAIGFNDLGGTGRYSGEFLVASKRYNDLDLTLGIGWGRLSGTGHFNNPFGWVSDEKKTRGGYGKYGGTVNLTRFFSGPTASIFGGLEYFTPIKNLSLKLEYDTSDYSDNLGNEKKYFKKTGDIFEIDSRINYALNYRKEVSERDKLDFSIGFLRGNTFYANIAVHSNLNFTGKPKIVMGAETLRESGLEPYLDLKKDWQKYLTDTIMWEMGNAGFVTHNVIFNGSELAAEISQGTFVKTSQAFDLASRILANNAPKNIEKITVINIDQGLETVRASIDREILVEAVSKGGLPENLMEFDQPRPLMSDAVISMNEYLYPNFFWEIKPHMMGTLQHQKRFYFWQLEALIHTTYSIKKGLYFTTDIGIDIKNNFDEYTYHVADGELYHVRQNRRLYLTEGETGIRRMALDYLVDIHPNIKAKFSAGYIEWMFGGIGGEVLYMPQHRRWALGLDAYWVKQRDFNQGLSFQDYETITGFLTYYRDIPFYDMRLKVSMGRFLAEDIGTHIDISRRFKTGARVGGIVALTDCDSACVGEGSFNKWIYFELPMDLFYTRSNTRSKTGYSWAPLTKDAGQKMEHGNLYSLMVNAPDEIGTLRQKSLSVKKIFSGFGTTPKKRT